MIHFATIFDINYLSRGLSLYESIKRHHKSFVLHVVCLDEDVYEYFVKNRLSSIQLITLAEIEANFNELLDVKPLRSRTDYIFTLSPFYPSYILKQNPSIGFICTLDCDQYFFSNSENIFRDLNECSVLIMPHAFTKELMDFEVFGKYNVSFQVFKNDNAGNSCLALWRNQCLEWCSDVLENDRFADQKYLDNWLAKFGPAVQAINNIGMGLAPWNVGDKKITFRNKKVYVNDVTLILYHYQGLRIVYKNLIEPGMERYNVKPTPALIRYVLKKIINSILHFPESKNVDSIARYSRIINKGFLNHLTNYGMLYKLGDAVLNIDKMYKLKIKMERAHGIFNRLKNIYGQKRKSYGD